MPATVPVTINLSDFGGTPSSDVPVTAFLNRYDVATDGTFVDNLPVFGRTEAGTAVLNLFPNALAPDGLGTLNTVVIVVIQPPKAKPIKVLAVIPNRACNLAECLVAMALPPLPGSTPAPTPAPTPTPAPGPTPAPSPAGAIAFASLADGAYQYGALSATTDAQRTAAKNNIIAHFLGAYDNHFATALAGAPAGCMGPKAASLNGIVNEGVGYWMEMCVVLEGAQSDLSWGSRKTPKEQFDGCLKLALARPANQIKRDNQSTATAADLALTDHLMAWKVQLNGAYQVTNDSNNPNDAYSALDGELDIALALLMAHRQWGSAGTYDYRNLALKRIAAIKRWLIRPDGTLIAMSRPAGFAGYTDGGQPSPAYSLIRTSDFMFNHFRAFARATQDPFWLGNAEGTQGTGSVWTRALRLAEYIQANLSAASGLLPDFVEIDGFNIEAVTDTTPILPQNRLGHGDPGLIVQITDNSPFNNMDRYASPADVTRGVTVNGVPVTLGQHIPYVSGTVVDYGIEDAYYSRGRDFDSNACRVMWRLGTEVLMTGNPSVKAVLKKINDFVVLKSPGPDITLFQDSYKMTGAPGDWASTGDSPETLGSALVGLCSDVSYAALRDNAYTWNFGGAGWRSDGYYSAEIQILSKITAAGFWWEPAPGGAIPAAGSSPAPSPAPTPAPSPAPTPAPAPSDGVSVLTAAFAGGAVGFWGDTTALAAYQTLSSSGAAPGAYGTTSAPQPIYKWLNNDATNRTAGRNWIAVDDANRANMFQDAAGVGLDMYAQSDVVGVGGSTTAFYCIYTKNDTGYKSTLWSDMVGATGMRLWHDGDNALFKFEVYTSAGLKTVTLASAYAAPGLCTIETRIKGGKIGIRRDKAAAWTELDLAGATVTAGNANIRLNANRDNTLPGAGPLYNFVVLKQYVPSDADANLIATYSGAEASRTI